MVAEEPESAKGEKPAPKTTLQSNKLFTLRISRTPVLLQLLKQPKIHTAGSVYMLAGTRAPPETSVLFRRTLITQSEQPLNPLITGRTLLHSSLFDLQNWKVEIKK